MAIPTSQFGVVHEKLALQRAQAIEARAKLEPELAKEREALSRLFKIPEWDTLLITIHRQAERSKEVMLSTKDHAEFLDSRSYYRALTWVMGLPDTI